METVNVEAGGTSYSGNLEMLLVSCRGEIQIFTTADGETDQMPPVTAVHSLEGSHLFYYAAAAAKQPDWVDIQTISVVELSDSKVWVFWGRAVNNRDLKTGHPNRYFRGTTLGELTQVSSECPAPRADSPAPSGP